MLLQIDRKNNLKRIPKASAHWYAALMRQNGIPDDGAADSGRS